jgi:hypothetical protein
MAVESLLCEKGGAGLVVKDFSAWMKKIPSEYDNYPVVMLFLALPNNLQAVPVCTCLLEDDFKRIDLFGEEGIDKFDALLGFKPGGEDKEEEGDRVPITVEKFRDFFVLTDAHSCYASFPLFFIKSVVDMENSKNFMVRRESIFVCSLDYENRCLCLLGADCANVAVAGYIKKGGL